MRDTIYISSPVTYTRTQMTTPRAQWIVVEDISTDKDLCSCKWATWSKLYSYFLEHSHSKDRFQWEFRPRGSLSVSNSVNVICDSRRPSRSKCLTEICLCYVNAEEGNCTSRRNNVQSSVNFQTFFLIDRTLFHVISTRDRSRLHGCTTALFTKVH